MSRWVIGFELGTNTVGMACVGIDLGTSYSCVGVWKNNRVEIKNSYVAFTNKGPLIGDAAKNRSEKCPWIHVIPYSPSQEWLGEDLAKYPTIRENLAIQSCWNRTHCTILSRNHPPINHSQCILTIKWITRSLHSNHSSTNHSQCILIIKWITRSLHWINSKREK